MIGIVIATHDHLADSLLKTAEAILGEQSYVRTLNIDPGATGLQKKIEVFAEELLKEVDELVWLVDMFGGTPFRYASYCVMNDSRQALVTGVNLPMVLQALVNRELSAEALTTQLELETKQTIRRM
ncbi:PTS sugar transporter subunit IIA [Enterococcus xiangfangensis]|uniref:PTS mannose/fructose/sorbose family IIA subunit n=1 Tax=Enterococcus xiangfangensis TaxID=1296537 RepID=A0ABU3FCW0_9ENTE|nr:PTS mannose/fructose/sorbose family IIA subunit [Enterococcus xiangfangensis]MBM7712046.1 mannose/fructose/sorbose-specific phosphotransferase system IIA component [Enterococcus xiangfangensis]MDT2760514.1 PTS mannose/fructose/sorbose family IIA subunit [Enterococcus xiangfangensis]